MMLDIMRLIKHTQDVLSHGYVVVCGSRGAGGIAHSWGAAGSRGRLCRRGSGTTVEITNQKIQIIKIDFLIWPIYTVMITLKTVFLFSHIWWLRILQYSSLNRL